MEEKKQGENVPEENPEVYTVKKDLIGWQFNRRGFLAAAGAATAAAVVGTAASCGPSTQGPVQIVDVVVEVTATHTATSPAPSPESPPSQESPPPTNTVPPTEVPKPGVTPSPSSTIAPTHTPTLETPKAEFVKDITIPDGTAMNPNQPFTKTWRYRNSGSVPWGEGVKLVFVSETIQGYRSNKMGGPDFVNVPNVAPGNDVDVGVNLVAPATPGKYRSYWRLQLGNGEWLENNHYVEIVVKSPATPTRPPSPTAPPCECVGHAGCGCDGDCDCVKHKEKHYWHPN